MKSVVRWSIRGLLLVMLVGVGLWGYAEGRQWLLRIRAQQLLADVQRIEINKSSWEEMQRFRARWGRWGDYQGSCDPTYCQYRVQISDGLPASWYWYDSPHPRIARLSKALGLRPSGVLVGLTVRRGKVIGKTFMLEILSSENELSTASSEGPRLEFHRHQAGHPYRSINRIKGDGFNVEVTPDESSLEKEKLMRFRLNCVTSLRPCKDFGQVLPEAYEELMAQPQSDETLSSSDCAEPYWMIARDEETVLVGNVLRAVEMLPNEEPGTHNWTVFLIDTRLLKGELAVPLANPVPVEFSNLAPTGDRKFPYRELIVAGRPNADAAFEGPMFSWSCELVEATPENLSAAERGVRADFGPTYQLPGKFISRASSE